MAPSQPHFYAKLSWSGPLDFGAKSSLYKRGKLLFWILCCSSLVTSCHCVILWFTQTWFGVEFWTVDLNWFSLHSVPTDQILNCQSCMQTFSLSRQWLAWGPQSHRSWTLSSTLRHKTAVCKSALYGQLHGGGVYLPTDSPASRHLLGCPNTTAETGCSLSTAFLVVQNLLQTGPLRPGKQACAVSSGLGRSGARPGWGASIRASPSVGPRAWGSGFRA